MFRRAVASACALIALLAAAAAFLARVSPSDTAAYKKFSAESKDLRSRRALERQPAIQFREKVQKDIWFASGDERLHFLLKGEKSELTLTQKKGKVEAMEKVRQIDCWIQDEIDRKATMQQVRRVAAAEGTYSFPEHRFSAQSVDLQFFRLPGVEIPCETSSPFLKGTAKEVRFAANKNVPTFTAYHLRAQIDTHKGLP